MSYATGLLEYSEDPLSDATPTYTNVTSYLRGDVSWGDGKSRDLDEPQAGTMSFTLKNKNREWEPEFSGAVFDAKPLRRFRWSVNGTPEGIWYAVSWKVQWPAGTTYSIVEVECVDGFELLSLDLLDLLDPPDATSYEEVVMQDEPFAYYRMGEMAGTQMKAETGPDGVYKGTPTLGATGLITGDSNTAVKFSSAGSEYARAPVDQTQFSDFDDVSVECWVTPTSDTTHYLLAGPWVSAISQPSFELVRGSTDVANWEVLHPDGTALSISGTTALTAGTRFHIVGTFGDGQSRLYVNGVLEASDASPKGIRQGDANQFLYIGQNGNGASFANSTIDEVCFYEYALSAERVLAHYEAGSTRGFDEEMAGERVAAVVASALWAETEIQTGEHMVGAVMEHGQSKLDEIKAAVKAEMPDSMFFFNGDGDPVYKSWNFQDGLGPQATFGAGAGQIKYQALEPVYDDEIFNEVTVGHQSGPGEETQHTATDTDSIASYFRRAHAETGLILTMHHDAIAVGAAILERHHQPMQRFANVTLNGANPSARTQILTRELGDLIRIKGLSASGTPIDVVTTIIGRSKTLTRDGHLVCTWNTARGFNAAAGTWRLGILGFTELNSTAILA